MTKLSRIVTILLWVLIIISAVLVISLMVNTSENDADPNMGAWINTNLIWAYILLAIGAGIAVIAGLMHTFSDIRSAKRSLISLLILAAVVIVAYVLASDAIPQFMGVQKFINNGTLTPQVAKMIDTGLIITYIMLGLAVLSIILAPVTRLFD